MGKIIVNADDFGYSNEINKAIEMSFRLELITTATLMPNMNGFDDAVEIVKRLNLNKRIGIHLNLTEGKPLSNDIKNIEGFVDTKGNFKYTRNTKIILTERQKTAIFNELESQIIKIIKSGIVPTHIDSHNHVHTEFSIGEIVIDLAKKYDIKSIRISRNRGKGISLSKKIYKFIYNLRLKNSGLITVDYFGDVDDLIGLPSYKNLELMVHPLVKNGKLMDSSGFLLNDVVDNILVGNRNHNLTTYFKLQETHKN